MRGEWRAPVAPAARRAEREQAGPRPGPEAPGCGADSAPEAPVGRDELGGIRRPINPAAFGNTAAACARERGPRDCAWEAGADSVTKSPAARDAYVAPPPSFFRPPLFCSFLGGVVIEYLTLGNWIPITRDLVVTYNCEP